MSSAFQNSAVRRSAPPVAQPPSHVDAAIVDALRALAPSIDPLVAHCKQGTTSTRAFDASRQFMGVQEAAADARTALEVMFPELKGNAAFGSGDTNELGHQHVRELSLIHI